MPFQSVFKRYELKYMLTEKQAEAVLEAMAPYMRADHYGRTTIRNLYFDTDSFLLIRRSIDKPVYKEKLRLRSYEQVTQDGRVFVELKKKYKGVVYKRRIALPYQEAQLWLSGKSEAPAGQIAREIDYFAKLYGTLHPTVFLSYERRAFYAVDGSPFRVTFDEKVLCRQRDLSLQSGVYGEAILPEGKILMEIKCAGGIPLWMTKILSEQKIYKTPFSKYGTAYKTLIFPQTHKINAQNTLEVTQNA